MNPTPRWVMAFDTETTGLVRPRFSPLARQPEVIEFYGIIFNLDTGEIDQELELLIRPSIYPMSEWTIQETKTRLSNPMLKDAPLFRECAEAIVSFLEQDLPLIAHNLTFDIDMIEVELERMKRTIKWPSRRVCTVEQTIHLMGKRLSLSNLHHILFEEKFADAHRARPDTLALVRCVGELSKRRVLICE